MSRGWRWRWLAIGLCALAGGALNIYRDVWWNADDAPSYHGFCAPLELQAREMQRFASGYCGIDIPGQRWRPLDITIAMRAPAPPPATAAIVGRAGRTITVTADDMPLGTIILGDEWQSYSFSITSPSKPQRPLALVLRADQPQLTDPLLGYIVATPGVGRVDVTPRLTPRALAWPALAGALFGIAAALLIPDVRLRRGTRERQAIDWRAATIACAALFIYFNLWALARPPYQTPDEVQHHMRTSSVLREPWLARPGAWEIDSRFVNPLARWAPPALDKLFFDPTQRLSRGDLRLLKDVEWLAPSARPPAETYERAIASYPTIYYLALFTIAEPLTHVLHLTPYDSTFAYRSVTAGLAALLWTLVFVTLRRLPETREHAGAIVALLVLNPMTGFMSSGINVDAANIPLAVLASLLFWRTLSTGEDQWWTLAALVATAWTKPSGLQLFGALMLASVALWLFGLLTAARVKLAALTLARAALLSWCGFYAWSPPRFLGGLPAQDTVATYLAHRWTMAPETWVTYWGKLGWLEYTAAPIWYLFLLAAVVLGAACAIWRPRPSGSRAFMLFGVTLLAAFVAETLAGEFAYLPLAGYVLQGRHLLPASLGLAVLVMHRVTAARVALIALLVVLNVLLVQATVDRYYNGQWKLAVYALPFNR
jgi:hypothetical protein